MHFPDRGCVTVYAPYAPCMSMPLLYSLTEAYYVSCNKKHRK